MGDPRRHVVLVGLMGVGKSTVGRRLAKELQRPFADVDEQVELRAGRTIPAIFSRQGEPAFRADRGRGAGRPAGPSGAPRARRRGRRGHRRPRTGPPWRTSGAFVVWLRASTEFLAARTDPTHRPLLAGDAAGTLIRLLAERSPLYELVADAVVDVEPFHIGDDKPKRALARHIAALVAGAPHGSRPSTTATSEP